MKNTKTQLLQIIQKNAAEEHTEWLQSKIIKIVTETSTKDLYLTYSLIASKFKLGDSLELNIDAVELQSYLELQKANLQQIARIYLLTSVLESNPEFFKDKVANIIQVADTGELETFLKFLVLLPNAEDFKFVAVDALRTNIATVFDAIYVHNPYPALYFDDQQWNQMFLKAAFMDRDLTMFHSIDSKANKDLARIISDYAHERWAAGRAINPYFWRPVSNYIEGVLADDMQRLLKSKNKEENKAAALCCYNSNKVEAQKMLEQYPSLLQQLKENKLTWDTLKD
ncbi:EboA domain-containing protein [Cellulophaga sp. F20128]|uniref:EboA domain-containing protein n=1 Tax=Cellulophaga sp. F20128 TaxID=2926413 RepID=UPI001FF25AB4|nr:EboA domain-containing protein [Cellulophaga sp. F20128]MCK0156927.1 EboA domain-containing protein [Cellulophaga sp. F20128]